VFNIGSGIGTSTLDLARTVVRLAGSDVEPVFLRRIEPRTAPVRVVCSTDLARNTFNFTASRSLADGITEEIGWFRSESGFTLKAMVSASA